MLLTGLGCGFDYKALGAKSAVHDAAVDVTVVMPEDVVDVPLGRDLAASSDLGELDQATEPDVPLGVDGPGVDLAIPTGETGVRLDAGLDSDRPRATGGMTGAGGAGGRTTGGGGAGPDASPGTGGLRGTGGIPGTGGIVGTGGILGTGGLIGTGGLPGTGGILGTGGLPGTGGILGTGGLIGTGGLPGTGGILGTGGIPGTGGVVGTGGTGPVAEPPSCLGKSFRCGAASENCCTTIHLEGGSFPMGRGTGQDLFSEGRGNEVPEHTATVAPFSLDKYEVTVGRMQSFVADYNRWRQAGNPAANAGANPNIPGVATGWNPTWNIPSDAAGLDSNLRCNTAGQTLGAGNENYPANCVNWHEAFAFCLWDGGRLATEAEWELAAAGGTENRLYPWGPEAPDNTRASFAGCVGCATSAFTAVGSYPAGVGRWGHLDLVGSVWEWVLDWYQSDWYSTDGSTCNNCVDWTSATYRSLRGSSWSDPSSDLRAAFRGYAVGSSHYTYRGARCARDP
jgi:formylglycine-generating enzyme required for sulfatase activity